MSATYSHDEGVSKKSKPVKNVGMSPMTANKPVPGTKPAEIIHTKIVDDNVRVQYTGKSQVKKSKELR